MSFKSIDSFLIPDYQNSQKSKNEYSTFALPLKQADNIFTGINYAEMERERISKQDAMPQTAEAASEIEKATQFLNNFIRGDMQPEYETQNSFSGLQAAGQITEDIINAEKEEVKREIQEAIEKEMHIPNIT